MKTIRYFSSFMFPEYPTFKEVLVAKMDVFIAELNKSLDDNEETSYALYESLKVYKRALEEFNESCNDIEMYAI